jgi:hypothetical protein
MASRIDPSYKAMRTFFIGVAMLLLAIPSDAQLLKKNKSKKKESATYAYQTFSTTLRKERRNGFAGDEARFQFEKPKNLVPDGSPPRIRRRPYKDKVCRACGQRH